MKKDVYELTSPQKNIWELEQINGMGTPINHILSVLKLVGNLDELILSKTINKIIENNDSFRLRFIKENDTLRQYVVEYSYTPIEIRHSASDDISCIIDEYQNFKLDLDNLFTFCLVFTPNFSYVIYKSHHIVSDAWSMTRVADQIKYLYEKLLKDDSNLDIESCSYIDFINREQQYLQSKQYLIDDAFWKNYVSNLSYTKFFNSRNLSKAGLRYTSSIDKELFHKISAYCSANSISEYSFFLGVFSLYFSKIYNAEKITFGTPFLNRQKRFNELSINGMFVSTLPLVVDIAVNDTFVNLCKKISLSNLALFKHSKYPYHKIQESYLECSHVNSALYEVGFSYQINKQELSMENADMGECSWLFSGQQNNPLTIHITTLNDEKVINYDFLTSCFVEEDISIMNNIIFQIIHEILSGKSTYSDISLLTMDDQEALSSLNDTGKFKNQNTNIFYFFDKIVSTYPDNIAIDYDDTCITYLELNEKINTIAQSLLKLGISKNDPVILFFDKSIEMIASMFAVLKAGGCYVPILPDENLARIEFIINDCKPVCMLTHKNYDLTINFKIPFINVEKLNYSSAISKKFPCVDSDDLAYIIYTSGSTGNPKGTMITHKNICSLRNSIHKDNILKATEKDVSISLLKYSFDASGIDIYGSLLFGGKLILIKKEDELNPSKVVDIMENKHVTRSFLIPKWIEHIAIQDKLMNANLSALKILGTGGEILKPYILKNLLSKYSNLKVLNLYGPTETTMFTTYKIIGLYEIQNNYTTIGKPICGSRLAVVNSQKEFLPINQKGELIIYEDSSSIKNIASGYLNLPEQTQNRFINIYNPIINKNVKAYRTGDLVRINQHLDIEFIGRNDDIVKVNGGYLVALNEIESRIQKLMGDNYNVHVIAIPNQNTKVIVVFMTTQEDTISVSNIRNYINNNVSFYMKPKKIFILDEFPRNTSGKINNRELEAIALSDLNSSNNKIIKPQNSIEIEIFNFLKELLFLDDFSITDDFIDDLCMDSLSLTALYAYLEKYKINIQDIYNNSTIKDLSDFIKNCSSSDIMPDLSNLSKAVIRNDVKPFDLSTVLLTGSTGFLGIHILRDLLLNKKIKKIYCLIRNTINSSGKKRLLNALDFYYHSNQNILDLFEKKVIVVNGNLAKINLGLSKKDFAEVHSSVRTVINCAANVKHFVKPDQIKIDNVVSVDNLIAFCEDAISLAHISTLSIAGFHGDSTENTIFDENTLYIKQDFSNNPYLVTKFEAEKNILIATNTNNLNAIIFRLGNIMPRLSDGKFQRNADQNVFLAAVKAIINSQVIAKDYLDLKIEFSPVDECSNMILNLLENNAKDSIYHILNDKELSISEFKSFLTSLNYNIVDTDLKSFIETVTKFSTIYVKEYILGNNLNKYSQDITLNRLKKLKLSWSKIDVKYIKKILKIIDEEM